MFEYLKAKKRLQKLIKGDIDEVLSQDKNNDQCIQMLYCALIQIDNNNDLNQQIMDINKIIGLVSDFDGITWCIMNTLLFVTFGSNDSSFSKDKLVSILRSVVNSNIKIVGKSTEGIITFLGEKNRFSYEPVISNFNELLISIVSINYGSFVII